MGPICGLLVSIVLAMLSGCASSGSNFDDRAFSKLIPGTTTEAQAIALLGGQPYQRFRYADGTHLSVWSYARAMLASVDSKAVSILFDERNVMVRFVSGVNVQPLPQGAAPASPYAARQVGVVFGNRLPSGDFNLQITSVKQGGLAEQAGWHAGDLIVEIDGQPVSTATECVTATQRGGPVKTYKLRRGELVFDTELSFVSSP
ncbi:MAG: PDZ domain-containing protein [Planctomycetes bacterium]|nr:PDZ domain-containing protein [Planctomycetota bacterium]